MNDSFTTQHIKYVVSYSVHVCSDGTHDYHCVGFDFRRLLGQYYYFQKGTVKTNRPPMIKNYKMQFEQRTP